MDSDGIEEEKNGSSTRKDHYETENIIAVADAMPVTPRGVTAAKSDQIEDG